MYLLYVDESGDTGRSGSKHLILTGVALFEGKWRSVKSDLGALLEEYFPIVAERPQELHATLVRRGKGPYSQLAESQRQDLLTKACAVLTLAESQRQDLLTKACAVLTELGPTEISVFAVAVEKAWWFSRNPGCTGDDLYIYAFENLVSRFDLFLKRRYHEGQPAKGLIVADPRNPSFSQALRKAVLQFHLGGTRWAQLQNIVESVLFLASHESPGLQLADLCSYAVWRAAEYSDAFLAQRIKYCFDREPISSSVSPGKWHGIRFEGPAASVARSTLSAIWPSA